MRRHALTTAQWKAIEPLCTGKESDPGATAEDNRQFVEAVVWIAKQGLPGGIDLIDLEIGIPTTPALDVGLNQADGKPYLRH